MMQQQEIAETLLKHSEIANEQSKVAEQHTDILLQLTNSYFELLEKVGYQKQVMLKQGDLINQCMERIMYLEKTVSINMDTIGIHMEAMKEMLDRIKQLEGRSILGSFNQRLEQLEDNTAKYYSINDKELSKMMEQVVRRVDALELWLSTHDNAYFQEEEEIHNREVVYHEQAGNSSFEEHEMHHPDPSYVEREDVP